MSMIKQMAETRAYKEVRGLTENSQCRLCKEKRETTQHLLAGCKMLASSDYMARHNKMLMVMAVAWAKEQNLLDQNVKWYQEKWKRRHVLENSQAKPVWDFEFSLQKTTSRRPDLMLEQKQTKTIGIFDVTCPQENNIEKKRLKKRTNYRQLAFKIRERRPGFKVKVVPLVISLFGGGITEILKELENMSEKDDLCERIVVEMQKKILMDSKTIIRKVLLGLVQSE